MTPARLVAADLLLTAAVAALVIHYQSRRKRLTLQLRHQPLCQRKRVPDQDKDLVAVKTFPLPILGRFERDTDTL
jgi:hypothetical protein